VADPGYPPIASGPVAPDRRTWIDLYAHALGVEPLPEEDVEALLKVASVAAHASERSSAPITCWLAAAAGVPASEALRTAERLGRELTERP
jgi:hypothetical protein